MEEVSRQRMYYLVLYSLSGIQKGIQCNHACIEYSLKYSKSVEYKQWANKDKTIIILSGGTSNNIGNDVWGNDYIGTMEKHRLMLSEAGIKYAEFHEPDLNNAMTSIAFLVPEQVWDKKEHPDPITQQLLEPMGYMPIDYDAKVFEYFGKKYGYETAFLRTWLKNFKLA